MKNRVIKLPVIMIFIMAIKYNTTLKETEWDAKAHCTYRYTLNVVDAYDVKSDQTLSS